MICPFEFILYLYLYLYLYLRVCCFKLLRLVEYMVSELGLEKPWKKEEFVEKLEFFRELSATIKPEVDFNNFPAAKGLIYSIQ
jgi:hypothetical protein